MNPAINDVIPAIASYVRERDAYLSKTKLLKLLYLFDVEYFRRYRRTFTQFHWKFFHLGPWTNELDPVLEDLIRLDVLRAIPSSNPEFDSKNLVSAEECELEKLFKSYTDESILKSVLNKWAERTTGEILDYVYFQTEPMEYGMRNTPLDFSVIPQQALERYKRSQSETPPKEAARLREQFRQREAHLRNSRQDFTFTPPRHDEEFFRALEKLDASSS